MLRLCKRIRGKTKTISVVCLITTNLRGEPWGRKPCRLKAGGRFATSCRPTPPRNAGRGVSVGTPEIGFGHLSGGRNSLKTGINTENISFSGVHPTGGSGDF
ncbi:MAG: hypothetical protein ACOYVD_09210 [Bacillota bacterium]